MEMAGIANSGKGSPGRTSPPAAVIYQQEQ